MSLLKDSLHLVVSSILIKAIRTISSFVVAYVLGPEKLGLLKLLDVIPSMAKYTDIGYSGYMLRNANQLVDGTDIRKSQLYNVALSASIAWLFLMSFVAFGFFSAFFDDIGYDWIVLILSISIVVQGLERLMFVRLKLTQQFKKIAIYNVASSLLTVAFVLSTIWYIDIYAPILAMLLAGTSMVVYLSFREPLSFEIDFNLKELARQTKVALPLGLGTLVYGLELYSERFIIDIVLDREILGRYMFMMMIYFSSLIMLNSFMQALSVRLYRRLDVGVNHSYAFKMIADFTSLVSFGAAIISLLVFVIAQVVIEKYFTEYSIDRNDLSALALIICLSSTHSVVTTSLTSNFFNKQRELLIVRFLSAAVFVLIVWKYEFSRDNITVELLYIKIISILILSVYVYYTLIKTQAMDGSKNIYKLLISIAPGVFIVASAVYVNVFVAAVITAFMLYRFYINRSSLRYLLSL